MIITPEIKAAADILRACAEFSITHPDTPLRNNPHYDSMPDIHWECPCGVVMPPITDDLRTACCGSTTVDVPACITCGRDEHDGTEDHPMIRTDTLANE
ncbi:hypothetical protein [Phytohabitans aurantiacus]|uniref:Uncharacterized protein n=1 Tax=Phytohabitans aurantiacus TaxID=3016789 RepID=A0ABQ5R294_9ACTN|nr:hypothetical protein [Phytohabitans aurantiacus]GLI00671.1 hypothetical protein Pa4123_59470 [Phytohabitans aurantiacus]